MPRRGGAMKGPRAMRGTCGGNGRGHSKTALGEEVWFNL